MDKIIIEAYWSAFLENTGRPRTLKYKDCYHFEDSEEPANRLLQLVLDGKKRATASSVLAYKDEPLPEVGDYAIITDWEGTPRCVVETTAVTIRPFREMTFEIVSREGEDDSLESWQQTHIRFFKADGAETGYEFSWDMPVLFEDFEVAYTGGLE